MRPTVAVRQHVVNADAGPPSRTPAGDAFTALLARPRQGVQRLADLLVRDGLAAYEDNPAHRRAKLLRITPQGRTALRTIQAAQVAWADALGAKIGEEELRQASILLDRVLQAVSRDAPDT